MAHFKVRKWSEKDARPFDVVFVDDDNHVYNQPYTTFTNKAMATLHRNSLVTSANVDFIRKHWNRETQA